MYVCMYVCMYISFVQLILIRTESCMKWSPEFELGELKKNVRLPAFSSSLSGKAIFAT